MTCNSKWPEIQEMLKLLPNVDPVDVPDIVSRVFKLKLDQLLDLIKKKNYFGKFIHVIEFQKCGLPHVHMLIWLSPESRPNYIEKVDQLVSAEIPDKNSDPIAYKAVKNYMMHEPCDKDLYTSPCMVKGKCMRHFPKRFNGDTYFDDCGFPVYRRRNTGRVINKKGINLDNQFGHDTATMLLKKKSNKSGNEQTARSVKNLDEKTAKWKLRQRGDVVGRLAEVHATTGESLYLRILLLRCKSALSFTQLRTIDGTTYDTFKKACGALGMLNNYNQWHDALEENVFSTMPIQIRAIFVNILVNCSVSDPLALWEKFWPTLSDDVLYMRRKISDNIHLTLSEYEIQNYTLAEGKIVLPVAGSRIAATLLPGGRTTHSRFKIPLKLDQGSIAGIKHGTNIAELMHHTSLIIWDEALMQHRYAFEAVDRSLRDIMAAVDVE
ncbi:uncharacterized protein LOC141691078 [Apium graveolens]|uniref:uncharacterized protein LOC141691078 n=1 Tax=Apium graveolens TaxID=4045 RepID=UPI003D7AE7DF